MPKQNEINERMRSILIDWLIQVHGRFGLLQETMYLTVYLLDKFLEVSTSFSNFLDLEVDTMVLEGVVTSNNFKEQWNFWSVASTLFLGAPPQGPVVCLSIPPPKINVNKYLFLLLLS